MPIVAGGLALYFFVRAAPARTTRVLAWMFTAVALFGLANTLYHTSRQFGSNHIQLFFGLPTAWLLLCFAYLFQGNEHPRESRWVVGASAVAMVGLLGWLLYLLLQEGRALGVTILPYQLFALALVVQTLGVFLRKGRLPGVRGQSHRAFARLFLLMGGILLIAVLATLRLIDQAFGMMLFNLLSLALITGFGFVYIYYTRQPISLRAQVVGLSFLTVVTVLAGVARLSTSEEQINEQLALRFSALPSLRFTPEHAGQAYRATPMASAFDTTLGTPLPLAEGVEAVLALPFAFPFAGQRSDTLYVNRNGLVAFGGSFRPRWLDEFYGEQPKIAPLNIALRPSEAGGVYVREALDQVTLTWHAMRQKGTDRPVNVQLVLFADGTFTFHYGQLDVAIRMGQRGVHTGAARPAWDTLLPPLPEQGARAMLVEDFTHRFDLRVHERLLPLFYGLLGASAIILLLFPPLFRMSLVRPLDRLLVGMGRVNEGHLALQVPVGARDEVGQLTEQFNQMTASLRHAHDHLQHYAENLEVMVEDRTTQITRQNEQLADQAARLRALDEAKSRFFANISHEFRTPLTLILGPLEQALQAQQPLGAEDQQLMLRNGQRLQRLINQILDLARLEAGSLTLDAQPHDLCAFVRHQLSLYESAATYRSIELLHEPTDDPCFVAIDPVQMEKVVGNLLSNALKFTDAGGQITVRCTHDGDTAALAFADTGKGIPEAALPHLFDRFYQVDDTATRAQEGSGIGLALVKELTELHGGTVSVASNVGRGTTFTVHLPRVEAPPAEVPSAEAPLLREPAALPAPRSSQAPRAVAQNGDAADRTTVLVVEDNADMRRFIARILSETFQVLEAGDGEAGLARAQAELPDLILADVMMPRMDGLALSRALKAAPETDSIPVILLTARAEAQDALDGLSTGADAYLTKPFQAEALRLQVQNVIARQHRLRQRLAAERAPVPASAPPEDAPSGFERQVRALIQARLADPALSVEEVADTLALSQYQLGQQVKKATGLKPRQLIIAMRLEAAAEMLRADEGTVSEIAYAVGFNSLAYFSRRFRTHYGVPPSAYEG